jgi:hypothetical protein
MATYVLQNSAQQIDQAVGAAYSGLIVGGTGLVRNTGDQTISGVKTFVNQAVFSSGVILGSPSQLNAIQTAIPTGDAAVDLGGASNRFKTGWFQSLTGSNAVFQNVTVVGTLNATIPASNLNNSTGSNVTLSGTTNLNAANFSGNINSAGTNTFSGNLNVSGNSVLNGTITATGAKTFSGAFSQSGNSNFFGALGHTGTLISTGTWNHTGAFNQTGDFSSSGNVSINSTNASFTFSGNNSRFNVLSSFGVSGTANITGSCNVTGSQHSIAGNIVHTGAFNHSGATILIGETRNTGNFAVVGDSSFSGNLTCTGRSVMLSGVSASGTSSAPAFLLRQNLTTVPSGGAIEYGNNSAFFISSEATGAPNRALLNPTYSIIAPSNSVTLNLANTGVFYPILNNTGIYLTTGTYQFYYNVNFGNPGGANYIRLGLFSSGNPVFSKRHGLAYKRLVYNQYYIDHSFNITGSGYGFGTSNLFGTSRVDESYVYASGTSTNGLYIDVNSTNVLNNFIFESVVTLTGNAKVFPVVNPSAAAMSNIDVREFNMRVTQLATGTGVGLGSASGPWSNL